MAVESAVAVAGPRFVRRTGLASNEYNTNFRMVDEDAIALVTSDEADEITPLMSKIYLKLVNAPGEYFERAGVLRVVGEEREGEWVPAWRVMCGLLGVASGTARKALSWMHERGVIGYFAAKNGVGIRVFINRAASSIGKRRVVAGQKILPFTPASSGARRASSGEAGFKDTFGDSDASDPDISPRAPGGASGGEKELADASGRGDGGAGARVVTTGLAVEELVLAVAEVLGPGVRAAAREAVSVEHGRAREWFVARALPKAVRVAQREAYDVLRRNGALGARGVSRANSYEVGRSHYVAEAPRELSEDEVGEMAAACVAVMEARGQSIEVTLSGMSSEAGGFLLAEDVPRVREAAERLAAVSALGGE